MAFRTVSLSEEAYAKLKAAKKEGESFTDVVLRTPIAPKKSILDFAGSITHEQADEWRRNVEDVRKNFKVRPWHN